MDYEVPEARMSHTHYAGGQPCDLPTKKACEDRYADWQAMQHVILAYNIVKQGKAKRYRKQKGQLAQLVLYIAGEQDAIMTAEGNVSVTPWVLRLMRAIERVKAGDVPGYTLYTIGGSTEPAQEANSG